MKNINIEQESAFTISMAHNVIPNQFLTTNERGAMRFFLHGIFLVSLFEFKFSKSCIGISFLSKKTCLLLLPNVLVNFKNK